MGCPTRATLIYGIDIGYSEDDIYDMEEAGTIEACPYSIFNATNDHDDEVGSYILEIKSETVDCCETVKEVNVDLPKDKEIKKVLDWVHKNFEGKYKAKWYLVSKYIG